MTASNRVMKIMIVVVLVVTAAACAAASDHGPPQTAPYIEGALTSVTPDLILVEEVPDGNKASLRIPEGMPVWRATPDGGVEPAELGDLTGGQTVAAWVSGPVAESFPVQATADAVLIHTS